MNISNFKSTSNLPAKHILKVRMSNTRGFSTMDAMAGILIFVLWGITFLGISSAELKVSRVDHWQKYVTPILSGEDPGLNYIPVRHGTAERQMALTLLDAISDYNKTWQEEELASFATAIVKHGKNDTLADGSWRLPSRSIIDWPRYPELTQNAIIKKVKEAEENLIFSAESLRSLLIDLAQNSPDVFIIQTGPSSIIIGKSNPTVLFGREIQGPSRQIELPIEVVKDFYNSELSAYFEQSGLDLGNLTLFNSKK